MKDALDTAGTTRNTLEALTAQNKLSLQNYRSNLNQTLLPQINQSLDGLASLSGSFSSTLNSVDPTIAQLKAILTQLKTSLNESTNSLSRTGSTLAIVDKNLKILPLI